MKIEKTKAFTIIELMVSIFITITVVASFYKLYEASLKTERTSSIRVSVNLLGEQIMDTIASSFRLIGLNGEVGDLQTTDVDFGIFRGTPQGGTGKTSVSFSYISPYGSPITKLQKAAEDDDGYPKCKFTLFNSAAFPKKISRLYVHNQQGVYVTRQVTALTDANYSGNNVTVNVTSFYGDGTVGDDDKWNWLNTADSGKTCAQRFPAGTLVSGEDFIYTLTYTAPKTLSLTYRALSDTGQPTGGVNTLINFEYASKANQTFQIPFFALEFLKESISGDTEEREWVTTFSADDKNNIIAIRFGFVLLSLKDRVTVKDASEATAISNTYCVFNDSLSDCYKLTNPNYTASVFQRVVDLSNLRMLKDQLNKKKN